MDTGELYLSPRQDQRALCGYVHHLLRDAPASEEFESFRKRLEIFFKDAYVR